jgi:hypothetical protein
MANELETLAAKPPRKALPSRFFAYWFENIKAASDWHENGLLIVAVILGVVRAACWLSDIENPFAETVKQLSEDGAVILAVGWCCVWIPFRRHERLTKQFEASIAIKEIRNTLGGFIKELEDRTNKIGAMAFPDYLRDLMEFEGRPFDKTSQDLIVKIYQFIRVNVGLAEAELFHSVTELSTNDALERQLELAQPHEEKTRTYTIARLQLHVKQLKSIIADFK